MDLPADLSAAGLACQGIPDAKRSLATFLASSHSMLGKHDLDLPFTTGRGGAAGGGALRRAGSSLTIG